MISDCFLLSTDIFPKMKYFNSFLIAILNFLNQTYHRKICRIVFIEGMEFFLCSISHIQRILFWQYYSRGMVVFWLTICTWFFRMGTCSWSYAKQGTHHFRHWIYQVTFGFLPCSAYFSFCLLNHTAMAHHSVLQWQKWLKGSCHGMWFLSTPNRCRAELTATAFAPLIGWTWPRQIQLCIFFFFVETPYLS